MRKKSLMTMVASLALVGVVGIGSTLAYFNTTTGPVTNTFTVGEGLAGKLTLQELDVTDNLDGTFTQSKTDWVTENGYTNIQPGSKIPKNPTVTLETTNVPSYVFVYVENVDEVLEYLGNATLVAFNDEGDEITALLDDSTEAKKLKLGQFDEEDYDGVYYFETDSETKFTRTLFDQITISKDAATLDQTVNNTKMIFKAGAIQQLGFENANDENNNGVADGIEAAWEEFNSKANFVE